MAEEVSRICAAGVGVLALVVIVIALREGFNRDNGWAFIAAMWAFLAMVFALAAALGL